jgi:hypothetical protein
LKEKALRETRKSKMFKKLMLFACIIWQVSGKPLIMNKVEAKEIVQEVQQKQVNEPIQRLNFTENTENQEILEEPQRTFRTIHQSEPLNLPKTNESWRVLASSTNESSEVHIHSPSNLSIPSESLSVSFETSVTLEVFPAIISRSKRHNGRKNERYRWSNATVPFVIDSTVISEFPSVHFPSIFDRIFLSSS